MQDRITQTRFVLIDDDQIYTAMLARQAARMGMKLDTYSSLLDMGHVGMLGEYDVAIVDFDLGNLNGVEIAEYLSSLFGNIPMILVSQTDRQPGQMSWPDSIRTFMNKAAGMDALLARATEIAARRGTGPVNSAEESEAISA